MKGEEVRLKNRFSGGCLWFGQESLSSEMVSVKTC
jgi:hypothetical protein